MGPICAVVVTHNRKDMLRKCLAAIASQTRAPERILVVDNASSDGTAEMLASEYPDVEVLALPTNEGGAGGFHEGMARAHEDGAEWFWLMDDDTIPTPDALAELLGAGERLEPPGPGLLASKVVWRDGRLHPMNAPWPGRSQVERAIDGAERGLLPLGFATFVSLLVHRGVVDRHGLPFKHFFIWSDDIEYTSRAVLAGERGFLVPTSVALHDTKSPHTAGAAPPERFYFHVRNTVYIMRGPGRDSRDRLVRLWILVVSSFGYLRENPSLKSASAIARGLRDGFRRLPPPPAEPRTTASRPAPARR